MSTYWVSLLLLMLVLMCQADTSEDQRVSQPRTLSVDENSLQPYNPDDGYPDSDGVRRFECPTGFFRLRGFCYYLSAGTAAWRDAHFHCTARNATLAVLNRYGKDKLLRRYLMGEQFRKLERWIGGIYNWRKMIWEWGVSGEKVLFQKFGNPETAISKNYAWHCLVLDPTQDYMWTPRSCLEHKYYICEVPAGRIDRSRRRKSSDPLAPQNQLLRPGSRKERADMKQRRRFRNRSMRKKQAHQQQDWMHEDNQIWAHGIKLGSRPPQGSRRTMIKHQRLGQIKGPRHGYKHRQHQPHQQQHQQQQPNQQQQQEQKQQPQQHLQQSTPDTRISQVTPAPGEYGAFPADGRAKPDEQQLQSLGTDVEVPFPRLFGNDFTREEILLKL